MISKEIRKYYTHRTAILALALAFGMITSLSARSIYADQADQQLPMVSVGYQSGTITGVYEETFQIDHRTYSLTPDAVLLDRHGHELHSRHLRVDIEVKYHLQKDSKDKIDRMILYLPY